MSMNESPGEVKPLSLAWLSRPGPFEKEPRTGGQLEVVRDSGSQGEGREDGSHWSQSQGQGEKMKPVDKTRGWKTPGKGEVGGTKILSLMKLIVRTGF